MCWTWRNALDFYPPVPHPRLPTHIASPPPPRPRIKPANNCAVPATSHLAPHLASMPTHPISTGPSPAPCPSQTSPNMTPNPSTPNVPSRASPDAASWAARLARLDAAPPRRWAQPGWEAVRAHASARDGADGGAARRWSMSAVVEGGGAWERRGAGERAGQEAAAVEGEARQGGSRERVVAGRWRWWRRVREWARRLQRGGR